MRDFYKVLFVVCKCHSMHWSIISDMTRIIEKLPESDTNLSIFLR